MRDFRDAKAMAQTLREGLKARSVSLTHSESLELIAKILGFHDWNVLSARIQSETELPPTQPDEGNADGVGASGKLLRHETVVGTAILDQYIGFYQLHDNIIFTVEREGSHLVTRLTGQRPVPIYAQSKTEFFAKVIDAQISFITDTTGHATSLVLHQSGVDTQMKRIDDTTAREIESKMAEKVRYQSASPGTEAALLRLIDGIATGEPNYAEMSPALAEATREQLPNLKLHHDELGAVRAVKFLGVGGQGEDVYSVTHENGASHWRIALDSNGTVCSAWVTAGP